MAEVARKGAKANQLLELFFGLKSEAFGRPLDSDFQVSSIELRPGS